MVASYCFVIYPNSASDVRVVGTIYLTDFVSSVSYPLQDAYF
jgi:hypothetical protein